MNKNRLLIGAIVGLSILVLILTIGVIYQYSNSQSKDAEIKIVNEKLQTTTSDLSSVNSEIDTLTSNNSLLKEEVDSLNSELNWVSTELAACSEEKNTLVSNHGDEIAEHDTIIKEVQSKLSSSLRTNAELKKKVDKYECSKQIEMDYGSILASSSRLQSFVDGEPDVDHVSYAYRDGLWTNTDTKVHGIRYVSEDGETYVMLFLVYRTEYGMKASTFWIKEQCWLDPP